jgi:O-antigen/teichoic acid export membrane protein
MTYYLTTEDYGLTTNFGVLSFLATVFFAGIGAIINTKFYRVSKEELKEYLANVLLICNVLAVALCVVCLLLSDVIENALELPLYVQLLCVVSVWFSVFTSLNMTLWRFEERTFAFGAYQISQSALNCGCSVLLVVVFLMGWRGRVYSQVIASVVMGACSLFILSRRGYMSTNYSKKRIAEILNYGLPIVPYAMSFWLRNGASKVLLTNMCDLSANGLYSVALTWTSIVTTLSSAFNNAYGPYLFKKLAGFDKSDTDCMDERIKLLKLIRLLTLGMILFVAASYVVSYIFITYVYAPSYRGSLNFLPWAMAGAMFDCLYSLFVCFVHHMMKTKMIGMVAITFSVLSVVIAWALILLVGSVGAAIAMAITSFAMFAFILVYAMRVYKMPWGYLIHN